MRLRIIGHTMLKEIIEGIWKAYRRTIVHVLNHIFISVRLSVNKNFKIRL